MAKRLWTGVTALALGLTFASSAQAATIGLDFSGGWTDNGSISWNGVGSPLIGSGLAIDFLQGRNTPENAGYWDVTSGTLDFQTGDFLGMTETRDADGNVIRSLAFDAGGFLTISGGIPDAEIDDVDENWEPTVLVDGTWHRGATAVIRTECDNPDDYDTCSSAGTFSGRGAFLGDGIVALRDLLEFFGLNDMVDFGLPFRFLHTDTFLNLVWTDPTDPLQGFFAAVVTSETSVIPPVVPEPTSITLLGMGLIGAATVLGRKRLFAVM